MKSKKEIIKSPSYWLEKTQNEFYRQFISYMAENRKNQNDMAKLLKVTKGYVSQILNGNFNPTLKKLIELSIVINKIPKIEWQSFDEYMFNSSIENETIQKQFLRTISNCFFKLDDKNMIEIKNNSNKENELEFEYVTSSDGEIITISSN